MDINSPFQNNFVRTESEWAADDQVYAPDCFLITSDAYYDSTNQRKFKLGDNIHTWAQLDYMPISGGGVPTSRTITINGDTQDLSANRTWTVSKTGVVREIWIDAGAMVARTTNGAASNTSETTTNDIMIDSFLFDGATEEAVQFKLSFPQAWNAGTVKVKVYWDAATGASAADGVVWGIKAGALANDDAIDTALGTEVEVTDTVIAVGDLHITSATSAVTIAGSPTVDEMVVFQIARKVGNASDDMTEDAKLLGIKLQYTETTTEPSAW